MIYSTVIVPTPSPTATPTPVSCEAEEIDAPSSLTLRKGKSTVVTVTVTGNGGCPVEGAMVKVTVYRAAKKRITVLPSSQETDENGKVSFTVTAKKKPGSGRITFSAGSLKKTMTVKVR